MKKQISPASLRVFASIGFLCLLHPSIVSAQNPGNVTGSILWLYGSQANANGNGITTNNWNDASASGNDIYGNNGTSPIYYDNATNDINYNPVVYFNGADYMNLLNNTGLSSGNAARTVFVVAKPSSVTGNQYIYSYGSNPTGQGYSVGTSASSGWVSGYNDNVTSATGFWSTAVPTMMTNTYAGGNNSALALFQNGTLASGSTNFTLNTNAVYYQYFDFFGYYFYYDYGAVGAEAWNNGAGGFNGNIAEIIQFPTALSAANQLKVTSYLAVKYGMTLDQTTATNYVNSAGTVTWNVASLPKYNNNIAAIGEDKNTSLDQTVSRSVNPGFQITVSLGTAITTPVSANTTAIPNDKSFFMWGDNNAATAFSRTVSFGVNSYYAMVRNWQIQKPNWGDQKVTITQDDGSTATYFLVATDSAFTNIVSATAMSAGTITLNTSAIPNGGYITFAQIIPLPVTLASFNGMTTKDGNQLTWVTDGEVNDHYFAVQRSIDGQNFEDIGQVPGMGTTELSQTYNYTDPNPVMGKVNYYRLHQVDYNGWATNSWIISLSMGDVAPAYLIYPNPVPTTLNLVIPTGLDQLTTEIYATDGKRMYRQVIIHPGSAETINVSRLVSGMYFLRLVGGDGIQKTLSFLKQ